MCGLFVEEKPRRTGITVRPHSVTTQFVDLINTMHNITESQQLVLHDWDPIVVGHLVQ